MTKSWKLHHMCLDIYWNTGSSQMTSGGAVHVRLACNCGREVWGRPSITIAGASIISCASRGEPAYHSTTTPPACITPPPTSTTLLRNQVKIKQRLLLDSRVCHSTSIHVPSTSMWHKTNNLLGSTIPCSFRETSNVDQEVLTQHFRAILTWIQGGFLAVLPKFQC